MTVSDPNLPDSEPTLGLSIVGYDDDSIRTDDTSIELRVTFVLSRELSRTEQALAVADERFLEMDFVMGRYLSAAINPYDPNVVIGVLDSKLEELEAAARTLEKDQDSVIAQARAKLGEIFN